MYAVPDVDEVVAVAKELGIHLGPEEAVLYRKHLMEQLREFDAFVQARLAEPQPPMASAAREPGYRPTAEEDPLNAWTWKCRIEGAADGALAGKTVSYKDHIAVAGMPMSFGSFALDGFVPDFDATVVTRVLQAGGTIIGKNVMNGLSGGFGTGGAIGDYGRPLNPHNHDHVTGGSSSGSAAAVAAGEVDISFGGDQGGSIRIPAAFCGIVGHKPTFGLVSHFGIGFGSDQSIDYTGPMTRTVEDAATALQVTAGPDPYDPRQTRDVPARMDVLGRLADGVARLRIGVLQEGFDEAEGDVRDLVLAAVDVLARAGADVSKVSIPAHHAVRAAQAALSGEGALALFKTGFFGAFTRTYYPAPLIAAINKLWASQADVLAPRTKLSLIAAELSRRNYHGRRVRQGPERAAHLHQGLRRRAGGRRRARDAHLHHDGAQEPPAGQLPRGRRGQPRWRRAGAAPATPSPSTTPATRRSPCPWASRRRVSRSACSSSGASSTIRSSCASPTRISTRSTGTRSSAFMPERAESAPRGASGPGTMALTTGRLLPPLVSIGPLPRRPSGSFRAWFIAQHAGALTVPV